MIYLFCKKIDLYFFYLLYIIYSFIRKEMSYCININSFDDKNVSVGKTSDYDNFKINKLYYKYDFNLSSELKLLTGFINVKYVNYKFNGIKITIESLELKNILKHIESIIPKENVTKLNIVPSKSESESDEEEPIIDIQNKQDNKEDNKEDNMVEIYFKNNKSELKLNPTKKSNQNTYILTKNENYNQIKNYYPYINKYGISGNFILYLSVVNGKIKFYIESGELKHPMSFTKRDTTIKNVYDTKVVIDI